MCRKKQAVGESVIIAATIWYKIYYVINWHVYCIYVEQSVISAATVIQGSDDPLPPFTFLPNQLPVWFGNNLSLAFVTCTLVKSLKSSYVKKKTPLSYIIIDAQKQEEIKNFFCGFIARELTSATVTTSTITASF